MNRKQLSAVTASCIALAVSSGASFGVNVLQNFSGGYGGGGSQNPLEPPDTNGAAGYSGSTEYVTEMINGFYGVYSPTGTASTQESMGAFWAGAAGYSALGGLVNDAGTGTFSITGSSGGYDTHSKLSLLFTDPRIVYDPTSSRWYASTLALTEATNTTTKKNYILSSSFLVGESNTSNPNNPWTGYVIPAQPTSVGTYTPPPGSSGSKAPVYAWADFDTLGVNGGNVYINGNMYYSPNPSNGSYYAGFQGATGTSNILVIPKASFTAPKLSNGSYRLFTNVPGFTNQAAQNFAGSTTTGYLYGINGNGNQLVQTTIIGTSAGNYVLQQGTGSIVTLSVGNGNLPTTAASQPGLPASVDTGDTRLSSNFTTADGYVWGTQMVANPSNTALDAIRWFAINPVSNTILAQGIITDPANSLYYGSIAVSKDGAVVIDFNESSSSQNISSYILTGTFNGTKVTMGATPQLLNAGTGVYNPGGGTSAGRWGDYSTIEVDPNNPNNFWIFQELPSGSSSTQWTTKITEIDPPGGIGVAVPEPGVLPLLFLGAAPLLLTLRRRKAGT